MNEHNPYQASAVPVRESPETARFPRRWRIAVLLLVASQALVSLLNLPLAMDLVRQGDISPLALLLAVAACAAQVCAGIALAVFRPRAATALFVVCVLFGGPVLLQWSPLVAITGLVIAVVGCGLSVHASRFPARR